MDRGDTLYLVGTASYFLSLLLFALFLRLAIRQIDILGVFPVFGWNDFDFVTFFHAIVLQALDACSTVASLWSPKFSLVINAESPLLSVAHGDSELRGFQIHRLDGARNGVLRNLKFLVFGIRYSASAMETEYA
jgi:hypothetical protein